MIVWINDVGDGAVSHDASPWYIFLVNITKSAHDQ